MEATSFPGPLHWVEIEPITPHALGKRNVSLEMTQNPALLLSVLPRKSSEIFGKRSEMIVWPLDNFWRIFGNLRREIAYLRAPMSDI